MDILGMCEFDTNGDCVRLKLFGRSVFLELNGIGYVVR